MSASVRGRFLPRRFGRFERGPGLPALRRPCSCSRAHNPVTASPSADGISSNRGPAAARAASPIVPEMVFHPLSLGADEKRATNAFQQVGRACQNRFAAQICGGVRPGEPLASRSASRISSTIRRDSGACSPRRAAIPVMTPCR